MGAIHLTAEEFVWSWWGVLGGILHQILYILLDFFSPGGDVSQVGDHCCNINSLSGNQSMTKAERERQERKPWAFACYITQKTHVLLKPLFGSCTCLHVTKRVLTYTRKFSDPEYF